MLLKDCIATLPKPEAGASPFDKVHVALIALGAQLATAHHQLLLRPIPFGVAHSPYKKNGRYKINLLISPRICSRTLVGYSRDGSRLPSSYADGRSSDDAIAFCRPEQGVGRAA